MPSKDCRARGVSGDPGWARAAACGLGLAVLLGLHVAAVVPAHAQIWVDPCTINPVSVGEGQIATFTAAITSSFPLTIVNAELYIQPKPFENITEDDLPPNHDIGGWGREMVPDNTDDFGYAGRTETATYDANTTGWPKKSYTAWVHAESSQPGVWSEWCQVPFTIVDNWIDTTGPQVTAVWADPDNVVLNGDPTAVTLWATADDTGDPGTATVDQVTMWYGSCDLGSPGDDMTIASPGSQVTDASYVRDTFEWPDGVYSYFIAARDSGGIWGWCLQIDIIVSITGDFDPPDTLGTSVTPPVKAGGAGTVTLTASIDDAPWGASDITAAEWHVDPLPSGTPNPPGAGPSYPGGTGTPMSAADGAWDFFREDVVAVIDISTWQEGQYTFCVQGKDAANHWGLCGALLPTLQITTAAPGNPRIRISGADIVLEWDTPPTGFPDSYNVYKASTVFELPPGSGASVFSVAGTATSWTDIGASVDGLDWYYLVRALKGGQEDPDEVKLGKKAIPLARGVSYASVPFELFDASPPTVFQPQWSFIESIGTTDPSGWLWYNKSGTQTLSAISPAMGLRVYALAPVSLPVVGRVPQSTTIPLAAGWNLVGHPKVTSWSTQNALDVARVSGTWTRVLAFDPTDPYDSWRQFDAALVGPEYRDLTVLAPGQAVWINMATPGSWTVPGQ